MLILGQAPSTRGERQLPLSNTDLRVPRWPKPNPFTRSIRVKLIVGTVTIVLAVVCILTFVIARNAANLLGKALRDQARPSSSTNTAMLSNFIAVREANWTLWVDPSHWYTRSSMTRALTVFSPGLRHYFTDYTAKNPRSKHLLDQRRPGRLCLRRVVAFSQRATTISRWRQRLLALPPTRPRGAASRCPAAWPRPELIVMKRDLRETEDRGEDSPATCSTSKSSSETFGHSSGSHRFLALIATPSWEETGAL